MGDFTDVPRELRALPQWLVWRREARAPGGKVTKVPYQSRDITRKALSTAPRTWSSFHDAVDALAAHPVELAGIGFVFADGGGLVGVDLDNSLDAAGELVPWARVVFAQIQGEQTYGEVSPSGKGIKLWVRGELPIDKSTGEVPTGRNRKGFGPARTGGVEMYQSDRYFAVTGRRFHACTDTIGVTPPTGLRSLYHRLAPPRTVALPATRIHGDVGDKLERCWNYLRRCPDAISGAGGHDKTLRAACETIRFDLSEAEAMEIMRRWNAQKCGGEQWSESELHHKLKSAVRHAGNERGMRLASIWFTLPSRAYSTSLATPGGSSNASLFACRRGAL